MIFNAAKELGQLSKLKVMTTEGSNNINSKTNEIKAGFLVKMEVGTDLSCSICPAGTHGTRGGQSFDS